MKFTITQKELAILQEKGKLFNYLSSTMTKTYFAIGDGKFVVFFRGAKGAAKLTLDAPGATEPARVILIDYGKWLNAVTKQSFAEEITISLTDKYLKVSIDGSSDMISLGITSYDSSSSEAETLFNFIESLRQTATNRIRMTEDTSDVLSVATAMLSTAAHNNAVALTNRSVMYADRSIVLKAFLQEPLELKEGVTVEVHKYTVGFMQQAMRFGDTFFFNDRFDTVDWESRDGSMIAIMASEPCEIAIPTAEELEAIRPGAKFGTMSIDHRSLDSALEFFNGFYEASVWKPITFSLDPSGSKLYYKHPTTEISKELDATVDLAAEFALSSENLAKLLSRSISRNSEQLDVVFSYDTEAAGVRCVIGDLFDVVFAKLIA